MPSKFNRQRLAPGYWASPWRFINAEQVPAKVRVMLQDKLIARGRWVDLYTPVGASTPGAVVCTCVKDTTQSADMSCRTCFGTKYAPGFVKFLHQTQFWCSAEAATFTLTNTDVLSSKKANVIELSAGQTTGTIVTQDKSYANTVEATWELKMEAYKRAAGETFTLELSTNHGTSWATVALTELTPPGSGWTASIPSSLLPDTGVVRFRITMTRVAAGDLPPVFEILRMRRVLTEHENRQTIIRRPDHNPGSILVLRPWTVEQNSLEPGRGTLIEHTGDRTWTMPLDFFDTSLVHDTPACRVVEAMGPHPFYSYVSGVQQGTRYPVLRVSYNEQLGTFTHQFFDDRRAQDGESYQAIW